MTGLCPRALLVSVLLSGSSFAKAQADEATPEVAPDAVTVTVVDVSGGRAYVEPGAGAGIIPGVEVRLGDRRHEVVAATSRYAVIEVGRPYPAIGATGLARRVPAAPAGDTSGARPQGPRPLEEYRGVWPEPVRPAAEDAVDVVPLGGVAAGDRRFRVHVAAGGYAALPLRAGADGIGSGELRARVHAEPWADLPFAIDVDTAARFWIANDLGGRAGGRSRPNLYVRQLSLRYGDADTFSVVGGRLRHAASLLGPLDGVRVSTPRFGPGVSVAAFGGLMPDLQSGAPSFDASRFGLEARFRDDASSWRPSASLVAHGSVFGGRIDERRLSADVRMFPRDGRLGAHVELSLHDAVNPWGVGRFEVSAAGLEGAVRVDDLEISGRLDLRRPERSRWLAASLPPGFLCAVAQAQDGGSGPCLGLDDGRYLAAVDVRQRIGTDLQLRGGGQVIQYPIDGNLSTWGGFAGGSMTALGARVRADLQLEGWRSDLLTRLGGRIGLGAALVPGALDLSVRYRAFQQIYGAEIDATVEHAVGLGVVWRAISALRVSLDLDLYAGPDAELMLVQLLADWRI